MKQDAGSEFDTSNYPEDRPSWIPRVNKKVLKMMKDECGGKCIKEICWITFKNVCSYN